MQFSLDSKIYIFCPANFATGGPEALHQLGYCLKSLGYDVYMHYFYLDKGDPVHESYKKYNLPYTNEPLNSKGNYIITPETYLDPIFKKEYAFLIKIVWWLSVTNYNITLGYAIDEVKHKKFYNLKSLLNPKKYKPLPTISSLKKKGILSLAHSYFSLDFLKKNKMNILGKISDYMSDSFYERVNMATVKEDILLYNPKKNGEYLELLKAKSPHLNWKALIDMSPDEVAYWMNKSKLYIDFGYHPGQERMPREAVLMGCCVITGSKGSAAYHDDVPLPDGFKFDEDKDLPEKVFCLIEEVLINFDTNIKLFENYKKTILAEKENFDKAVRNVFGGEKKIKND
ncbi:hypothetical protein [Pedobacter sp. R20-19]|uniref:hypothetical protein n=1 Tax=Pedobacter sp. R20-19 TaxID=1270196 RepID=UPI0004931E90|nr:hypothetical protein [Pedobacter sp. R20-19]